MILKQSTAVDVLIGPFVDLTDGYTSETGESPAVKLSKNGQALAAKNDATTPVSDADGYYNCELDATDTATVGTLVLTFAATAGARPIRHEFQVIEEIPYDAVYLADAVGFASQASVDAIGAAGGAAISIDANDDNYDGGIAGVTVLTTKVGTQTGTFTNVAILDGVTHKIDHDNSVIDIVYQYLTGGGTTPVGIRWSGFGTKNDVFTFSAWDHVGGAFEDIGNFTGNGGSTNATISLVLFVRHVGTSAAELGKIYIRIDSASTNCVVETDQLIVDYAVTSRTVGYDDGAIWLDTVRGTAGTESFVNGTGDNPSKTLAEAITIAAAVGIGGIYHLHLINDSAITLTQDMSDWHITGAEYSVALGGQLCDRLSIHDAQKGVTGTFTGNPHILGSPIGVAGITGPKARIGRGAIQGPIVNDTTGGQFVIHNCWSTKTTTAFDFGAAADASTAWLVDFWGIIEIRNMGASDVLYIASGGARVTFASSCTAGTVNMSGTIEVINNGSGMTFNDDAVIPATPTGISRKS